MGSVFDTDYLDTGWPETKDQYGEPVVYAGSSVTGVVTRDVRDLEFAPDSRAIVESAKVKIGVDEVATMDFGDKVTFDGKDWYVWKTELGPVRQVAWVRIFSLDVVAGPNAYLER